MSNRDPLIIILLKFPFLLANQLTTIGGLLAYAPVYIFLSIFQKFLFNDKFQTDNYYYVIFWIPRQLIVIAAFSLSIVESLYIGKFIYDLTIEHGSKYAYFSLFSTIIIINFMYRRGYLLSIQKLNLGKLKSVIEHFQIILDGIQDLISLVFAIGVCVLFINIQELAKWKPVIQQKTFLQLTSKLFFRSFFDILVTIIVFVCYYSILHILRWRLGYTKYQLVNQSDTKKIAIILKETINSFIDIIVFLPILIIQLISPFLTIKRTITLMRGFKVILWRRIIFDGVINMLYYEIFPIFCIIIGLPTIYKLNLIKICYKLKLNTINFTKTHLQFDKTKFELPQDKYDERQSIIVYQKISNHLQMNLDEPSSKLAKSIFISFILDIIAAFSFIFVFISYYKYKKIIQVMKQRKMSFKYHSTLVKQILPHLQSKGDNNLPQWDELHLLIIVEFFQLLMDLPFIILYFIMAIVMHWRYRQCKFDRQTVLQQFLKGILDIILFIILSICGLLIFWRMPYLIKAIKGIYKGEDVFIPSTQDKFDKDLNQYDNLQKLSIIITGTFILDLLCLPFALILIFSIYGDYLFVQSFISAKVQPHQFSLTRVLMFKALKYTLIDFLTLILNLIIILTQYRVNYKQKFYNLEVQEFKQQKKESNFFLYMRRQKFRVNLAIILIIIFDILGVIPLILIYITVLKKKSYLKYKEEYKQVLILDDYRLYRQYHFKLLKLQYINIIKAIIGAIIFAFLISVSFLFLWRYPTIYYIVKNDKFQKQIIGDKHVTKMIRVKKIIIFVLLEFIADILCFPIHLLCIIQPFSLIRYCNYVRKIPYRYIQSDKTTLEQQINYKRKQLVYLVLMPGYEDLLMFFQVILIFLTMVRVYFFIHLLGKNKIGYKEFFNEIREPRIISNEYQLQIYENREKNYKQTSRFCYNVDIKKLTSFRCTIICFIESLKDLPYIPFVLIIVIIAPWRFFKLINLIKSQKERIPTIDKYDMYIVSRRNEVFTMLKRTLTVDAFIIMMNIILILSLYKIRRVIRLGISFYQSQVQHNIYLINFNYIKELKKEIKQIFYDFQTVLQILTILFLLVHAKKTYNRLKRLQKQYQNDSQINTISNSFRQQSLQMQNKKEKKGLQYLSYNIFQIVGQYLNLEDLTRLSMVSKQYYLYCNQELFYEQMYSNHWNQHAGFLNNKTYKEMCVEGYINYQSSLRGKPIEEEQKDKIYGYSNIIFEEFLLSLFDIPHLIMTPAKLVGKISIQFKYTQSQFSYDVNDKYSVLFPSLIQNQAYQLIIQQQQKIDQNKNFFFDYLNWQNNAIFGVGYIILKFSYRMSYIISYPCYMILTKLSRQGMKQIIKQDGRNDYQEAMGIQQSNLPDCLLYFLQAVFTVLMGFYFIILYLTPLVLTKMYTNTNFLRCIIGPFFVYILHYVYISMAFLTIADLWQRAANQFHPHNFFQIIFNIIKRLFQYIGRKIRYIAYKVTKPLFDVIRFIIRFLYNLIVGSLKKIIELILFGIKSILKLFTTSILFVKDILGNIFQGYMGIIANIADATFKLGFLGDIILTIVTPIWMFWPLAVSYKYSIGFQFSIYMPSIIFSFIFLVSGYKRINYQFQKFKRSH